MQPHDLDLLFVAMTLLVVAGIYYVVRLQLDLWRAQQVKVVVVEARPIGATSSGHGCLGVLLWIGFVLVGMGWYAWLS